MIETWRLLEFDLLSKIIDCIIYIFVYFDANLNKYIILVCYYWLVNWIAFYIILCYLNLSEKFVS